MNADLIKNLLKGQGDSPITTLLPMLFGGKTPDLSSLLGGILGQRRRLLLRWWRCGQKAFQQTHHIERTIRRRFPKQRRIIVIRRGS